MLILFIITSVLYLIMMFFVISLYYIYHKDYEELEKQFDLERQFNRNMYREMYDILNEKEGDTMACKKGRGGRKK